MSTQIKADDLAGQRQRRVNKIDELKKIGINPYPSIVHRTNSSASIHIQFSKLENKEVVITGRLMAWREHGKLIFADLVDESGKVQLFFKQDAFETNVPKGYLQWDQLHLLDVGDFIEVCGIVSKTKSGEESIIPTKVRMLGKTIRPIPDQWHGLKDIEERYRKRYLDIILNPEVKSRLMIRSKIVNVVRNFLTNRGFVEVETPTLQPVYGGGFARPFSTHHNELEADLYLRISDEMYLKRLIVGGFEKVFEITKVFRNEGIDHDHNPEFTMFEAQIAFENYTYGMDIIEEIIEYAAQQVLGTTEFTYRDIKMSVKRPWARYKLVEAIQKFTGIDPMQWKTIEEARTAIKTLDIAPIKMKELIKMQTIGECITFVFEEKVEEQLIQPTIIYDYPIEISPLAKKCEDPRFTERFEMFAFGSELGNNYTELNDPIDLKKRFIEEKKREAAGFDEAHQTDNDYLEAIEYGFPPTCGIAIGMDRLIMLLTDAKSIKEVIAFPTLRPEKQIHAKVSVTNKIDSSQTLSKEKAMELLHAHMQNANLRRHCYAVGYAMRALAEKLHGDPDSWEVMGILHDADWEETKDTPTMHTVKTLEWLKELGITEGPLVHAFQSHNRKHTNLAELDGGMEWALETVDELTGFIVAVTLIRPDKKLETVTVESIMKKWTKKEFAAAVDRNQIAQCEEKLGIPLPEFIQITLGAMQAHHDELGL